MGLNVSRRKVLHGDLKSSQRDLGVCQMCIMKTGLIVAGRDPKFCLSNYLAERPLGNRDEIPGL